MLSRFRRPGPAQAAGRAAGSRKLSAPCHESQLIAGFYCSFRNRNGPGPARPSAAGRSWPGNTREVGVRTGAADRDRRGAGAPAVTETDVVVSAVTKMPYSGDLGSQYAVSRSSS